VQVLARGGSVIAVTDNGNHDLDEKVRKWVYLFADSVI
jgi:hypothetical protein